MTEQFFEDIRKYHCWKDLCISSFIGNVHKEYEKQFGMIDDKEFSDKLDSYFNKPFAFDIKSFDGEKITNDGEFSEFFKLLHESLQYSFPNDDVSVEHVIPDKNGITIIMPNVNFIPYYRYEDGVFKMSSFDFKESRSYHFKDIFLQTHPNIIDESHPIILLRNDSKLHFRTHADLDHFMNRYCGCTTVPKVEVHFNSYKGFICCRKIPTDGFYLDVPVEQDELEYPNVWYSPHKKVDYDFNDEVFGTDNVKACASLLVGNPFIFMSNNISKHVSNSFVKCLCSSGH